MVRILLRTATALAVIATLLVSGAEPADATPGRTELVSVSETGVAGDDGSLAPAVSADGRYVAFASEATDLVPGDTNDSLDIFVRDLATGTTERVSVASDGSEANDGSYSPDISGDGRYVVFWSAATNLDATGERGVYVRDRVAGTTEYVSVAPDGSAVNELGDPSISDDGSTVAFTIWYDTFPNIQLHVRDLNTGTTTAVGPAFSGSSGIHSDLSATGTQVAILVPPAGSNGGHGSVWHHDRTGGTTSELSEIHFVGSSASLAPSWVSLTADGRRVVYADAVPCHPPCAESAVFLYDMDAGTETRLSTSTSAVSPSISGDGRYVAYQRTQGSHTGVVVHDRDAGSVETVSTDATGSAPPVLGTYETSVSGDGSIVAFDVNTDGLVPEDTNGTWDVYAHDRTDYVYVDVSVQISYHNAGYSPGNIRVTQLGLGLVRVAGSATIPGANGGEATVSISLAPFWILPIYLGSVVVSDPGAGLELSTPVLFGNVAVAPPPNAAVGGCLGGSTSRTSRGAPTSFGGRLRMGRSPDAKVCRAGW